MVLGARLTPVGGNLQLTRRRGEMPELYQKDPYLKSVRTTIAEATTAKKKPAVSLAANILYPGGGQPADKGFVTLESGQRVVIERVLKMNRKVYAVLGEAAEVAAGDEVEVEIDWARRYRNMRYHTGAHVIMAAISRGVRGYEAKGIDIAEDGSGCALLFTGEWGVSEAEAKAFVEAANRTISAGRQVLTVEFETLSQAIEQYKDTYRGPKEMGGPVSIIVIEGWDANPCGGTHVANLSEIGPVELDSWGQEELRFHQTG